MERNQRKHQECSHPVKKIIIHIKSFISKVLKFNKSTKIIQGADASYADFTTQSVMRKNKTVQLIYWSRPSSPFVKVNVDGSFKTEAAGAGGIFRDYRGRCIVNFSDPCCPIAAQFSELAAVHYCLLVAKRLMTWSRVIEMDWLATFQLCMGQIDCPWYNVILWRKILSLWSLFIIRRSHIFREPNRPANW